ncbi:MAG: outer membrane beta-barrel protein [Gammaproteobacteria bacterium]|nr:outer membrane beta-barrel protein [Gammaproteobacteria bacterium]
MTRNLVRISLLSSAFLFTAFNPAQSFAYATPKNSGWFIGAGGSWNWSSLGNSASVANGSLAPPPSNSDLYTINTPSSHAGFQIYAGYRFVRAARLFPYYSFAFRYTHIAEGQTRGVIQQYSSPTFQNYNYSVNFNTDIYGIEAKLDLYQFGALSPYLSAGAGIVNNSVYNYQETAVSGVTPRISPDFGSSDQNNFAFNLGVGIDYQITQNLSASLGYEYANLDKLTGTGKGADWVGQPISFGTLKNNTVLLNVFYQIA